jgi:hypothetical protein
MTTNIPDLTESELATLKAAKTQAEWNAACDAVKRVRSRAYPNDWYEKVIASGLVAKAHDLPVR